MKLKTLISDRIEAWHAASGIDKLLITRRRGSVAVIIIPLIALFFAFGFWWPYWRVGDMDMWIVYEAFLFNDGLRQEYFDHPGYLTILLLGQWLNVLHAVGLLSAHALSDLPPVADLAASGRAWMQATQAARVLSLLIGLAFVSSFAALMRILLRDWRIAALAAFILAFSGGVMMEMRVVRTELIAAGLAHSALLILLIAACRVNGSARPLLVGIAALLATLAMLNKVQIVFLLGVIPPMVFLFGREVKTDTLWQWSAAGVGLALLSVAIAAATAGLAFPIVWTGLVGPAALAQRVPLFGTGFPVYQALIAIWIAGWMTAYAVRYRVNGLESLATFATAAAGVALGLLALTLRYDVGNAAAVLNPLEHMLDFMARANPELMSGDTVSSGTAGRLLLNGIGLLLARLTFFLSSSPRPAVFLEWAVIGAAVVAWRRGERKIVLQVVGILAAALAVDLVGALRGLKLEYFIITDPLIIIAGAWLLSQVPDLQYQRWTFAVGSALMIATVAVGLAEPVKHTFKRDMPLDFCVPHYDHTKRIESFSFCPKP